MRIHRLLLAMIQSGDERGSIRVTAQAEGLDGASIDIDVGNGHIAPRLPIFSPG